MFDLKEVPNEEIYHVVNVESVKEINWDEVAMAKMIPRPERTLTPPQCYGQLVMVKDYGFVCRLFSDDKNPVAICEEEDGAVCNDSALEFFVQFEESGYLNIETNFKGISHQKFGNPGNRKPVAEFFEERFVIETSKLDSGWEAVIYMPFEKLQLLSHEIIPSLFEKSFVFRGNFYTMTSQENGSKYYYCQWVDTKTEKPAYHVPERFGYFVIV